MKHLINSNTIFRAAVIGLAISVALVWFNLATQGHAAFNSTNLGIHWSLPIVVYDYFLLTSTGLSMVATLALIFGGFHCQPVVRRCLWLAMAALIGGVSVLALELGHPLRAIWAIPTSFAFSSPLFWKVWFVIAYTVLLPVLFWRLNRPASAVPRGLSVALLLVAVGLTAIAGSVYGSMAMRAFWSSGEVPVAFIVESLLGGLAFLVFFSYLAHGFDQERMPARAQSLLSDQMPTMFALAIMVHLLFVVSRTAIGLYSNAEGAQVWGHIVTSPVFLLEIVSLVLALVLLTLNRTRALGPVQALAALLAMVSLFIARYDYIIGGQIVPLFKGAKAPEYLNYMPSFTEWMLLLMAIFLANAFTAWGEDKFDLSHCSGQADSGQP
jgi:Ni/Fe-hydrogenase subunit HybB-like protein